MKHRLLCLAALVTVSVAGAPPATLAASPEPTPTLRLTVPLRADCTTLPTDRRARELLREYAVCGFGQATTGDISAQSSISGNCGSVSLSLANAGGGYLQWRAEITSTVGPFVFASYSGTWRNMSRRTAGAVNRSFFGLTSDWVDRFRTYTRSGWTSGQITSAGLMTFWGLTCTNALTVEDYAYVTGG